MEADDLGKESLGVFHLSCRTAWDIDEIAIGINPPIEITPRACYLNMRFICLLPTSYGQAMLPETSASKARNISVQLPS